MNLDKLIKWVLLLIGATVLIVIVVAVLIFAWSELSSSFRDTDDSGIALNNTAKENQERIKLGLRYGYPRRVGSSDVYIIEVSVDYSDNDRRLKGSMDSYEKDFDVRQPSNIIFTDNTFVPIRRLLGQKGLIVDYDYPGDNNLVEFDFETGAPLKGSAFDNQKHIAYRIALSDTDGDGQISANDTSDLYLSDLDGSNFTQITSGWVIDKYNFVQEFSTLLIGFYESADAPKENLKFASYRIQEKKLTVLEPLGKEIEVAKKILQQ